MKKIISMATALTIIAASTGQLPKVLKVVHIAQLQLLKDSQASKWPKAQLLGTSNPNRKTSRGN